MALDRDLPRLGLGAGSLGADDVDLATVRRLLDAAIDHGWSMVDTAPSYGESEVRLGEVLASLDPERRGRIRVSTKLGYGIPGVADWTGACITAGVDRALERLRVERLDLAFLHSCPWAALERSDVMPALERAVAEGKVALAGYSGDNDDARQAVASGAFGVLQTSVNVVDRWASENTLTPALDAGMDIVAKRALSNAVWRLPRGSAPERQDLAVYFARWRATGFADLAADAGLSPAALAIRWVVHHTPVHVALVGTRRPAHVAEITEHVAAGPLADDLVETLKDRVREAQVASMWAGLV